MPKRVLPMSKLTELIEELCPEGVGYEPLGEVVQIRNGQDWKSQAPGDIPVYGSGGRMQQSVAVASSEGPSVLLPRKGSLEIQYVEEPIWNVDTVFTTVCDVEVLNTRFFYFVMKTIDLRRISTSATRPSLTQSALRKLSIPVPPLEVQQEIVRVLDAFTDLEQSLVAELELRKKQFEFYRGQLFHFDHSVEWSTLGDVSLKVTSGGTPSSKKTSYYGGDIPWLRTQEVNFEDIYSTGVSITEEGLNNSSAKWIPANCVIVAMYGATAAKSAINAIPLTTNQACCNLQIDPSLAEYRFVYYWVSHMYEHLKKLGEGSQSNLNAKKVKSFPVPVPPLETQREIIDKLCEFESLIQSTEREIVLRRKQYEFYRDELLCFTVKEA